MDSEGLWDAPNKPKQTLARSKCREGSEGDREGCIISREQRLHIRELIGKQGKIMRGVREAR